MTESEERTCRFPRTVEEVVERDRVDGLVFVRLSCVCWQRVPGPGEVVLSIDDGYEEVWVKLEAENPPASG